jgi:hypothetical protein
LTEASVFIPTINLFPLHITVTLNIISAILVLCCRKKILCKTASS